MKPCAALILGLLLLLAGCGRPKDRSWGTSPARDMVDVDLAPIEQNKRAERAERVDP